MRSAAREREPGSGAVRSRGPVRSGDAQVAHRGLSGCQVIVWVRAAALSPRVWRSSARVEAFAASPGAPRPSPHHPAPRRRQHDAPPVTPMGRRGGAVRSEVEVLTELSLLSTVLTGCPGLTGVTTSEAWHARAHEMVGRTVVLRAHLDTTLALARSPTRTPSAITTRTPPSSGGGTAAKDTRTVIHRTLPLVVEQTGLRFQRNLWRIAGAYWDAEVWAAFYAFNEEAPADEPVQGVRPPRSRSRASAGVTRELAVVGLPLQPQSADDATVWAGHRRSHPGEHGPAPLRPSTDACRFRDGSAHGRNDRSLVAAPHGPPVRVEGCAFPPTAAMRTVLPSPGEPTTT